MTCLVSRPSGITLGKFHSLIASFNFLQRVYEYVKFAHDFVISILIPGILIYNEYLVPGICNMNMYEYALRIISYVLANCGKL